MDINDFCNFYRYACTCNSTYKLQVTDKLQIKVTDKTFENTDGYRWLQINLTSLYK